MVRCAVSDDGGVVGGRGTYEAAEHWGAGIIRQFLEAGLVDELTIIVAPLILGDGKRLFDGFTRSMELQQLSVRQSRFATFIEDGVMQSTAG